jgi:hypothetical protein
MIFFLFLELEEAIPVSLQCVYMSFYVECRTKREKERKEEKKGPYEK